VSDNRGTSDESIGRPQEWREGRYQQPGKSIEKSVITPAGGSDGSTDPISKPVTHRDYEQPKSSPAD
jgi:hypothetical protein